MYYKYNVSYRASNSMDLYRRKIECIISVDLQFTVYCDITFTCCCMKISVYVNGFLFIIAVYGYTLASPTRYKHYIGSLISETEHPSLRYTVKIKTRIHSKHLYFSKPMENNKKEYLRLI